MIGRASAAVLSFFVGGLVGWWSGQHDPMLFYGYVLGLLVAAGIDLLWNRAL